MAAARIGVPASPTNRNDRAALGVIATYLHELTEHGRPREPQPHDAPAFARTAAAPALVAADADAPAATPVIELISLGELDDELAEMADAGCYACAA
ncbi:hypothetical protein VSS74_25365 [Conexibacter stalactiti]|uniref:Uncharacterized protein n=1 Tax=Conexibacter stalactiti TaxID=1940611 RepID=A0ABU4HWJ8_9ACTN|nr:hypothetical protein [Conexibacter stalactiti]MDW5597706.1 hypothetical protein [Conexibacter stalactiti]MEC5038348.1 hypothetical protein [Conexibacter stalactiti]